MKQRKGIVFLLQCVSVHVSKRKWKAPVCSCVGIRVAHLCAVVLNQAGVCGWYLQLQQCWSPQRGTSPWGRDSSKLISTHTFMHTHTKGASWGIWGGKKVKWEGFAEKGLKKEGRQSVQHRKKRKMKDRWREIENKEQKKTKALKKRRGDALVRPGRRRQKKSWKISLFKTS